MRRRSQKTLGVWFLAASRGSLHAPLVRQSLSIALGLVVWQLIATYVFPNSLFFVPFTEVLAAEVRWFSTGTIWRHIVVSGLEFLVGLGVATVVGIVVGALIGVSGVADALISPWVALLYSTPLVAITPLYILLFGIDLASKMALVFTIAVFTIIVNTAAGFRTAEGRYVELARAYGASQMQLVRKILFPSAVPFILTGLKLASGRGIIGVVVGEFLAARAGLGFLVAEAGASFRMAELYAGVLLLALAGLLIFKIFDQLERLLTPWRDVRP